MKTAKLMLFFILCASVSASAQNRMNRGGPGQRVEQFKKLRLIEALKLSEDVSVRFFAKYTKHEEAVRGINTDRDGLLDQLQGMRKSDASDAEMGKVIDNLVSLDKKLSDERSRFAGDIKEVLSTKQIADLFLFERSFARNVRQLMQEMAQGRRQGQR